METNQSKEWNISKIGNPYDEYEVYDETGRTVAYCVHNPNNKDNAKLISLAPAMMEIMKELYNFLPNVKASEQIDILHRISCVIYDVEEVTNA